MSVVTPLESLNVPRKELSQSAARVRLEISEAGRLIHDAASLSIGRGYVGAVRFGDNNAFVAGGFTPRTTAVLPSAAVYNVVTAQLTEGEPAAIIKGIAPVIAALLAARADIQSVIYTQSPNLTAFAVARRSLPVVYGFPLLRRTPHDIPVTRGQRHLDGAAVLEALARNPKSPAVLLANRGVLVFGSEPLAALSRVVISLEEAAGITINAVTLGGAQPFPATAHAAVQQGAAFE